MVAVVGSDFPEPHLRFLGERNVDLRGLQIVDGKTFSWAGRYSNDLDEAITLDTQLNAFADFHPRVPDDLCDAEYVFLANIDPDLQIEVLSQVRAPKLTALDSMNYWIKGKRDALERVLALVDVVLLNETETKLLTRESNPIRAARRILDFGPKVLVVKKGHHGCMLLMREGARESLFFAPAYPLETVVDPTGAGDSFAGGFLGYLARGEDLSEGAFRRAVVHGSVIASFTVEGFSVDRLRNLTLEDVEARYQSVRNLTCFDAEDNVRWRASGDAWSKMA